MDKILCSHIISEIEKGNWNMVDNKKIINIQCFPLNTKQFLNFSYVKLTVEKNDENSHYKGSVTFESEISFMRQKEDEGSEDFDELNQQTFYTQTYEKLHKCVCSMVKILGKIDLCSSCNNIYQKLNDTTNLCMNCAIQLYVQKPNTECSICLDENALMLPYKLDCGHEFHFSCLSKMKHFKCPLCRTGFTI